MVTSDKRPPGMSQLDWLWMTYKDYNVADTLPSEASSSLLLTDKAIRSLISEASGGGITKLLLLENAYDDSLVNLVGYDYEGKLVTLVEMPKEDHIKSLAVRNVTESDGDCGYEIGTRVFVVTTRLEKVYMVSTEEIVSGEMDVYISADEGNIISRGSDGGLFASIDWVYV